MPKPSSGVDGRLTTATTHALVSQSVQYTPGWSKVRQRTKQGQTAEVKREVLPQEERVSTVITCRRETGLPISFITC